MPTAELNKALAAFQADLPTVAKGETAEVPTKAGGSYSYDYAPLEDVSAEVMPALGKHGLAFTAFPGSDGDGRVVIDYALLHESGEERGGQFPLWLILPERATAQTLGGYFTYFRRYLLCATTGVAPGGEDNDAADTEVKLDRPQRTKAKIPGPAHEQLRHGTVERTPDDQIADRGPVPPEQDLWAGQPAGPYEPEKRAGTAGGRQRSQIFAKFKILGIADAGTQRSILTQILGREVSSRATLSATEADEVIKDLQARTDAKEAAEAAARVAAEQDAAAEGAEVTKLAEHRGEAGAS